jgi:hypothetical protein
LFSFIIVSPFGIEELYFLKLVALRVLGTYKLLLLSQAQPLMMYKSSETLDIFCFQGEKTNAVQKMWTTLRVIRISIPFQIAT